MRYECAILGLPGSRTVWTDSDCTSLLPLAVRSDVALSLGRDLVLLHAAGYRRSISSPGQALQQPLFQNRQIMAVYPTFK